MSLPPHNGSIVQIDYTNHRGERAWRTIVPIALTYKSDSEWHGAGYVLQAIDFDRRVMRDFDPTQIHEWRVAPE